MKRIAFVLLFLAACAAPETGNPFLDKPLFCNVDADCMCGGKDTTKGTCFIGNKLYASKYVDLGQQCPDFCTGITGNMQTKCVSNKCTSVVVRTGIPGEKTIVRSGCQTDNDCVKAECCHATSCVLKIDAPNCAGIMCTAECRPGSLDCGGKCACIEGQCVGQNYWEA